MLWLASEETLLYVTATAEQPKIYKFEDWEVLAELASGKPLLITQLPTLQLYLNCAVTLNGGAFSDLCMGESLTFNKGLPTVLKILPIISGLNILTLISLLN